MMTATYAFQRHHINCGMSVSGPFYSKVVISYNTKILTEFDLEPKLRIEITTKTPVSSWH